MRIILSLILLLVAGQPQAAPYGFGADTTGGEGGGTCTWTDEAGLRACVLGDVPMIALASGNPHVTLQAPVSIGSNKTIAGPAVIDGQTALFKIKDASNIVIRGLALRTLPGGMNAVGRPCPDPTQPLAFVSADLLGCGIPILVTAQRADVTHIWIDGIDVSFCGDKCIDMTAVTGTQAAPNLLEATGQVPRLDGVTISHSRFHDAYYGILVSVSGSQEVPQVPGNERVTIFQNSFDRIYRRSPRAANGAWIDFVANSVRAWNTQANCKPVGLAGFGSSANNRAQLLARDNVYDAGDETLPANCRVAISITADEGPGVGPGLVRSVRNSFLAGALDAQSLPLQVFRKPY